MIQWFTLCRYLCFTLKIAVYAMVYLSYIVYVVCMWCVVVWVCSVCNQLVYMYCFARKLCTSLNFNNVFFNFIIILFLFLFFISLFFYLVGWLLRFVSVDVFR